MKIIIIGAGFTGLSAAWDLAQAGHQVEIWEQATQAGGMAQGFQQTAWDWSLEQHYHHVFSGDQALRSWLSELGLSHHLFYQVAKTATYGGGQNFTVDQEQEAKPFFQLDSAQSLLAYPYLSWPAKLRTGLTLAFLKLWPWGQGLEKWTAARFLQTTMGQESWQKLWQPLFQSKFGQYASEINAAWFWARIHSRSRQLGYYQGGFQSLADAVVVKLKKQGVEFTFGQKIDGQRLAQFYQGAEAVLHTGNQQQLQAMLQTAGLSTSSMKQQSPLPTLAAMTLVLELDEPFLPQDIYWLNINQPDWPFLAAVEHTNLVPAKFYGGQHLLYLGRYLSVNDPSFSLSKSQLFKKYQPYLAKLGKLDTATVQDLHLFKTEVAQPVTGPNHSQRVPSITTNLPKLFWAGIQQIYPHDRGINYAVQLGRQAAQTIAFNQQN